MSDFLPLVTNDVLQGKLSAGTEELFEFLVEPIHEELYRRQDFTFIDQLSEGQQLLVSYDYVRLQVLQGGFIQLIQNGYIGILPPMPAWLQTIGAAEMAKLIDDVLKVYVLNRELLDKSTTVEEFARLYDELGEFAILDEQFSRLNEPTIQLMIDNARKNLVDYVKLV
jgi:hypothetical protein